MQQRVNEAVEAAQEVAAVAPGLYPVAAVLLLASASMAEAQEPASRFTLEGRGGFNVPTFDIRQQCSGFLYGLDLADSLLRSGKYKRVLLIGAEVHSPFMPWQNGWDITGTNVIELFGSACDLAVASADDVTVETCQNPEGWWAHATFPLYGVILLMLIGVEALGAVAGGSQRWLDLGIIRLQPSELMKPIIVLTMARFYEILPASEIRKFGALWPGAVLIGLPAALVMLQPDLGSALVFSSILVWCLFWAGTPLATIFFLVSPVLSLFLSITPWVWGVYIVLLLVLLIRRDAFISEKASIWLANAAAGSRVTRAVAASTAAVAKGTARAARVGLDMNWLL